MTNHTPGPWSTHGSENTVFAERYAVAVTLCAKEIPALQVQANARLVAAAPELLEALRDVLDHFEWQESGSDAEAAYDAAVAAIAKATQTTEGA